MTLVISGKAWLTFKEMQGSYIDLKNTLKKVPSRHGRLDGFSRLGLAAVGLTLEDAGKDEWESKRDIGLIASSRYGCLESDVDYYATVTAEDRALASPNLFAYTLPNCFIGEVSISYGLTGTNYVVMDDSSSQLNALKMAWDTLNWGESKAMVAGVLNRPCPESVESSLNLSHSALFFLLEESSEAVKSYGRIEFKKERLYFNGQEVKDVETLAKACM